MVELELCGTALATRTGVKVLRERDMNRVARLCGVVYIITLLRALDDFNPDGLSLTVGLKKYF